MQHAGFFERSGPFSVDTIARAVGASLGDGVDGSGMIDDVKPLQIATAEHLSFIDNRKYLGELSRTRAGACIVSGEFRQRTPASTTALEAQVPYQSFARAMKLFYPDAMRSKAAASAANQQVSLVHPSAQIDEGVIIEPGAVVGREARIGAGTIVTAGAVVGYRVVIGRDGYIGANSTVTHAIIGDGVIVHAGVRIGQDGFGFAMSAKGHEKIPQIGRVLIGNDVEIGSNTTIDRGSLMDTVIGDGTKIDNLVQIAHNVVIGRNCIIVAQSGIAGSTQLGDFVVMGAHSGVLGHLNIGAGTQIAGMAHVKNDLAAGSRVAGTPAQPFNDWARELATLKRLSRKRGHSEPT